MSSRLTTRRCRHCGITDHANHALHGELFICVDEAVAQAKEFKTSWQSEVVRYVVHGVLHLLGHDDLQPACAPQNEARGKPAGAAAGKKIFTRATFARG